MDKLGRGLVAVTLRRRSPRGRVAARVLGVIGPAAVAFALLPLRSSLGLAGMLFCTLLVVVVVGAVGGVWLAVVAAGVGAVMASLLYAPPYDSFNVHLSSDLVAVVVFGLAGAVVGTIVGTLIDQLARLANEQAALRRVATLVAHSAPPDELFAAVTNEAGQLLAVDVTTMYRFGADGTATVVASWHGAGAPNPPDIPSVYGNTSITALATAETGRATPAHGDAGVPEPVASGPRETASRSGVGTPIIVDGRAWGVMIAESTQHRPLPHSAESRLVAFTDLVATAIANAESRAEVTASRARLVASADEARRRIERDLHDGAQQRLVSLGLELRIAQTMVPPQRSDLVAQLSRAAKSLSDVEQDLQEISRGVHPAILSKGGIGPAIKMLARRSPIPVELDLRGGNKRWPEWLEVAAYYVVSESLTNAAKHSHATVVHVELDASDERIELSIRDDGAGGADPSQGSGLTGLTDRITAFGGTIAIASAPGAGTELRVTVPIDAAAVAGPVPTTASH